MRNDVSELRSGDRATALSDWLHIATSDLGDRILPVMPGGRSMSSAPRARGRVASNPAGHL